MITQRERRKNIIAPESNKTRKARDKLLRQWKQQERLITPQALSETIDKIKNWIAANAPHRAKIERTSLRLFDHNENPAPTSRTIQQKVQQLAEVLQAKK
ncbi:MAG: hypothetical protein HY069_01780 [Chlamydiia bacterium]|nr:hypothetical protein [Chlamydiia bacterium]